MTERWHGKLYGYSRHGCRCVQCRQAHREYFRDRRKMLLARGLCPCGQPRRCVNGRAMSECTKCHEYAAARRQARKRAIAAERAAVLAKLTPAERQVLGW